MREIADEGDLPSAEDALAPGFVYTADLRQVYVHSKRSVGKSVSNQELFIVILFLSRSLIKPQI